MPIDRSQLLVEACLQLHSAWTLATALALISILAFASVSSVGSARAMSDSLTAVRNAQGRSFPTWLSSNPEAAPYRDELANLRPGTGANVYLAICGAIGPLLAAIWGARVIGAEFGARTARVRAAHGGWSITVAVKQVVMGVSLAAAPFAVLGLGVGAGHVCWHVFSSRLPWASMLSVSGQSSSPLFGALVVAGGILFYGLFAFLIALITRSTAASIVVGLAFPFAEGFARQWWLPQSAYGYLLGKTLLYNQTSFIAQPQVPRPPSSVPVAAATMIVWLLAVVVGSRLLARRQQIS